MSKGLDERKKALEEEYFRRKEQEALEKTRQRIAADESKPNEGAFMRCPKCGEKLEQHIFNEIKVDRCSGCHGIWLDPGKAEHLTPNKNRTWAMRFWRSRSG
jgi:hypothetical protein